MFDSQADLAALVYEDNESPDGVLLSFADSLSRQGYRAVGLVQGGQHCADGPQMDVTLIHSGEKLPLLEDIGPRTSGCRLDVSQLLAAGVKVSDAIDQGADLVIINRFGKMEREGKGLLFLIERALDADIPVVIAVPYNRFSEWIKFSEGMSVKLRCNREALSKWWTAVSVQSTRAAHQHQHVI